MRNRWSPIKDDRYFVNISFTVTSLHKQDRYCYPLSPHTVNLAILYSCTTLGSVHGSYGTMYHGHYAQGNASTILVLRHTPQV